MDDLEKLITDANPGTTVHNIDGFDNLESMTPMWDQVDTIKGKMVPIMTSATDGVHLICFSQGMLNCKLHVHVHVRRLYMQISIYHICP